MAAVCEGYYTLSINLYIRYRTIELYTLYAVLDLSGGWGFNPPLVSLNPQVCFDPSPEKIVKISQKYIADPPPVFPQIEYWLYVTSQTICDLANEMGPQGVSGKPGK